jgi:hypothetical protein
MRLMPDGRRAKPSLQTIGTEQRLDTGGAAIAAVEAQERVKSTLRAIVLVLIIYCIPSICRFLVAYM